MQAGSLNFLDYRGRGMYTASTEYRARGTPQEQEPMLPSEEAR